MKMYLLVLAANLLGISIGYFPFSVKQQAVKTMHQMPVVKQINQHPPSQSTLLPPSINGVKPPAGYMLIPAIKGSFGEWLMHLPLRKNNTLYLHNDTPKPNQTLHYAILDVPYSRHPLQQCADAVMRLRAEYLFATKAEKEIHFYHQHHTYFTCSSNCTRTQLEAFLQTVFSWCGTYNLQAQLKPITNVSLIKAGDVLVKGGSPGHAMLVAAVAQNAKGKKVFLLLQSFIPAQDIHLVINPFNEILSPWYAADATNFATPGWTFYPKDLRTW